MLSVLCAALICRELGGGELAKGMAALFAATIPEGILQASGAKNDYVLTGWILSAAYWTLLFRRQPGWIPSGFLGASIGLAVLTKGTAYPFLPALALGGVWCGYYLVRQGMVPARRILHLEAVVVAAAVLLNTPQLVRNYLLFQKSWGRAEMRGSECHLTNKRFGPSVIWSNAVRNLALHLSSVSPALN